MAHHRAHIARERRSDRAWASAVRCPRSCACSCGRRSSRRPRRARRCPGCSGSPTSPRGRAPAPRVSRAARTGSGCQWQWQSTRLPSAGSTSTVSATSGSRKAGRGRKLPTIVWRWPLARPRCGSNEVSHPGSPGGVVNDCIFMELLGSRKLGKLETSVAPVRSVEIGAASGDRTHDILSHSQAFCR